MKESVVFFSKHAVLNVLAFHLVNVYLIFGLHSLYNHSVLCFPNNYHMVKEEKGNRYDLKNINCNKQDNIFFLSVSKVCDSLVSSGGICPGGIFPGGFCQGRFCPQGKCPGVYAYVQGVGVWRVSAWGVYVRGGGVMS